MKSGDCCYALPHLLCSADAHNLCEDLPNDTDPSAKSDRGLNAMASRIHRTRGRIITADILRTVGALLVSERPQKKQRQR
jgi:hypothetical protein